MNKKTKNANLEWLRIISMFMVVILHTLDKGNLLRVIFREGGEYVGNVNVIIAWMLEAFAVVAVNIFFMISGYVLVDAEFKSKRIFSLIMEMVFYGGIIYVICTIFHIGQKEGGNYEFLQSFLPVHMDVYWFMTVYFFMYLMLPFVSKGVKLMNQKQHLTLIIMWLIFESLFKSVLPVKLDLDRSGYDLQWAITLFLIATYIKQYGFKIINKAYKGLLLYFVCAVLVFAEQVLLDYMLASKVKFTYIQHISYSYNHVFTLLASIGLFAWGLNSKQPGKIMSGLAKTVAPYVLGVYLMHEHVLIRHVWPTWLDVSSFAKRLPVVFVFSVLGVALLVFVIGIIVDIIRSLVFKGIGYAFKKTPVVKGFERLDDLVNGKVD